MEGNPDCKIQFYGRKDTVFDIQISTFKGEQNRVKYVEILDICP